MISGLTEVDQLAQIKSEAKTDGKPLRNDNLINFSNKLSKKYFLELIPELRF